MSRKRAVLRSDFSSVSEISFDAASSRFNITKSGSASIRINPQSAAVNSLERWSRPHWVGPGVAVVDEVDNVVPLMATIAINADAVDYTRLEVGLELVIPEGGEPRLECVR